MKEPRRRASAPEPEDEEALYPPTPPSREWFIRMALGLVVVAACSALGNLLALIALGGAIANLGAPQGPLDFALVFLGAVVGLGGDYLIFAGSMRVLRPRLPFTIAVERVLIGLGLQVLAAALVGTLESSWGFAIVYLVLLGALAYLWHRLSPSPLSRPLARHPEDQAEEPEREVAVPSEQRFPIPWVGTAPPPPSAPKVERADGQGSARRGSAG